jgi:hypothetical protein
MGQGTNCADQLKKARRSYNEGIIEKVESILRPCLENGFSDDEKLEAYKLIILANIYDEKIEEAEKNMLKFLHIEPEYEINPSTDPEEFAAMFNDFHTSPRWSLGLIGGLNLLRIRQLEEYGTYNTKDLDLDESEGFGASFLVGLRLNRFLMKNTELQLELLFEQDRFKQSIDPGYNKILQQETQTYVTLPLSVTYDLRSEGMLIPYARLGLSTNYLVGVSFDVSRNYSDLSPNSNQDASLSNLNDSRERISFSGMAGVGLKWKVKRAFIVMDVRYRYGFNSLVNPDERYAQNEENSDRLWRLHYIDNDFSIDKTSISFGYVRNFYKPRKRKKN